MAFIKTNAAIVTHNLSKKDARTLAREPFPTHPDVGDTHEGFAWDGGPGSPWRSG